MGTSSSVIVILSTKLSLQRPHIFVMNLLIRKMCFESWRLQRKERKKQKERIGQTRKNFFDVTQSFQRKIRQILTYLRLLHKPFLGSVNYGFYVMANFDHILRNFCTVQPKGCNYKEKCLTEKAPGRSFHYLDCNVTFS